MNCPRGLVQNKSRSTQSTAGGDDPRDQPARVWTELTDDDGAYADTVLLLLEIQAADAGTERAAGR
eukprot:COSAG02_NODE_111_length_36009_cov_42.221248_7_plen_66_part_00